MMADTAVDRKKAKADYLAHLAKQKQQQQVQAGDDNNPPVNGAVKPSGGEIKNTREAILEQRRKDFFEKRKNSSGNAQGSAPEPLTNASLGGSGGPSGPKKLDLFSETPVIPGPVPRGAAPSEAEDRIARAPVAIGAALAPGASSRAVASPRGAPIAVNASESSGQRFKQEEYARQLRADEATHQRLQQHDINSNSTDRNHQPNERLDPSSGLQMGGSPNKQEARATQRAMQEEYARQLQQDQHRDAPSSHKHGAPNSVPAPVNDMFAAQGANPTDERSRQREKQQEYARQLQLDQNRQAPQLQADRPNPPMGNNSPASGGGLALAGGALRVDEKAAVRAKHDEYARQLHMDQQQAAQLQQQQNRGASQHEQGSQGPSLLSGLPNNQTQDRASNRARQEEYARQLQQDQQSKAPSAGDNRHQHLQHPPYSQHQSNHNQNPLAVGVGGGDESRAAQRQRQEEYARQLQMDQQRVAPSGRARDGSHPSHGHNQASTNQSPSTVGIGGGDVSRAMQRQRQEEYARQLHMDQMRVAPGVGNHNNYQQHNSQQNRNQYDPSGGGIGNQAPQMDEKAIHRARQDEYARQLQFDLQQKAHMDPSAANSAAALRHNRQQEFVQGLSQAPTLPNDGFVIGPLGLPVRRTLEVGNRGQQKAYNNQISPNKQSQMPPRGYPHAKPAYGNYDPNSSMHDPNVPAMQVAMQNAMPSYPGAINQIAQPGMNSSGQGDQMPAALNAGLHLEMQDERELKAKQLKLEHVRALEQQILENKRRIEEEKRQEEERDKQLQEKIEEEQRQLALKFNEETKKAAAEEERKNELTRQMEEKKRQKEEERQLEQEMEERETAKALAGAEELVRRERMEIEREQAVATQAKGHQGSSADTKAGLFDRPSPRPVQRSAPQSPPRNRSSKPKHQHGLVGDDAASFEIIGDTDDPPGGGLFAPPSPTRHRVVHSGKAARASPRKPQSAGGRSKLHYNEAPSVRAEPSDSMGGSMVVPLSPSVHVPTGGRLFDDDGARNSDDDDDLNESLRHHRKARRQQHTHNTSKHSSRSHTSRRRTEVETDKPGDDPLIKRFQNEAEMAKQEALDAKKELDQMRRILQEKERQELARLEKQKAVQQQESHTAAEQPPSAAQLLREDIFADDITTNSIVESSPQKSPSRSKPFSGMFEKPLPRTNRNEENMPSANEMMESSKLQQSSSLSDLKTLKSDSRFVFPDGTSFVPGTPGPVNQRIPTSGGVKLKGANALTPMKEDVTHRMGNLLDRMDDSDIGDSKQAGGRVQLPPRNVIRHPNDSDSGGHRHSIAGRGGEPHRSTTPVGEISSRPSTVGVGNTGRRKSRRGDGISPNKHKKSIRKYINTDLSSSNENDVQFYNKDSTQRDDDASVNNAWRSASHRGDISSRNQLHSGGHNDEASGAEYDVDGTLRKNRRKLNFLSKIGEGGQAGMDELDLLLSMNEISSRPTTTASNRPATMQGNSKFISPSKSNFQLPHDLSNGIHGSSHQMLDMALSRPGEDPYAKHPSRPSTSAAFLADDEEIGTMTVQRLSRDFTNDLARNNKVGVESSNRRQLDQDRQTLRSAGQEVLGNASMKGTEWNGQLAAQVESNIGSSMEYITPRSDVPVPIGSEAHRHPDSSKGMSHRPSSSHRTAGPGDSFIDFSEFGL